MEVIKPLLAGYLNPLPVCATLLGLGVVLLWLTKRTRAGTVLVTIGLAVLILFGEGTLSSRILKSLEYRYKPVEPHQVHQSQEAPLQYVVVLSAGHISDPNSPLARQITWVGLVRLIEGIRFHKVLPGSKLVLSGDSAHDPVPESGAMAKLAVELGVNEADIIVDPSAKNTEEQVQRVQAIVGQAPFMLVTSALHMPRAMALFEKSGLHPMPIPTGYYLRDGMSSEAFDLVDHLPRAESIRLAERAMHEYLGLAWSKLRGKA